MLKSYWLAYPFCCVLKSYWLAYPFCCVLESYWLVYLFLLCAQILMTGKPFWGELKSYWLVYPLLALCSIPIGWQFFSSCLPKSYRLAIFFGCVLKSYWLVYPLLAVCSNSIGWQTFSCCMPKYYWLANLFLLCSQILLAGVPFLLCSQVLLAGLTFIVDCPNPIGWQTFFCCVLKFYWLAYLSIVVCSISIGWLLLSPTLTSWFHHCKTYRGSAPRPIPQQAPVLFGIIHAVSKTHISKPRQRLSAS